MAAMNKVISLRRDEFRGRIVVASDVAPAFNVVTAVHGNSNVLHNNS